MADFSLPVTVPDDKVSEFLDALRWHYKMPTATPAQLRNKAAEDLRTDLIKMFKAYKRYQLEINPPSDEINIT